MDILKAIQDDLHGFANEIKEEKIPIEELMSFDRLEEFPPLLVWSILLRSDCSLDYFEKQYKKLLKKTGALLQSKIMPFSKRMDDLYFVQIVLGAKSTKLEELYDVFFTDRDTFNLLFKNPILNNEFRLFVFSKTRRKEHMTKEMNDIFI